MTKKRKSTKDQDLGAARVKAHLTISLAGDLLARRKALGLSVAQVAGSIGVSRGRLKDIERAEGNASVGLLSRLAAALGLEIEVSTHPATVRIGPLESAPAYSAHRSI